MRVISDKLRLIQLAILAFLLLGVHFSHFVDGQNDLTRDKHFGVTIGKTCRDVNHRTLLVYVPRVGWHCG
jgi:hypothetical protein